MNPTEQEDQDQGPVVLGQGQLQWIDHTLLDPSGTNVRRTMDRERLESLRDSILDRGILQTLIVVSEDSGRFRVVAGNRRLAALRLALERVAGTPREEELRLVPVHVLAEDAVEDAQWIQVSENLHRDELGLETEVALVMACAKTMSPNALAKKLSLARHWVERRYCVGLCGPEMILAVAEKRVTMEAAQAVAQIRHAPSRAAAVKRVLNPVDLERPLNAAEAEAMVTEEFTRTLSGIPWEDDYLEPVGGRPPCVQCPKARRDPSGIGRCTDLECWRDKLVATWNRPGEVYAHRLPLEECDALFAGGTLDPAGDWIDLGEQVPYRMLGHFGAITWKAWLTDLLGRAPADVTVVREAIHPAKATRHWLARKDEVQRLIRAAKAAANAEAGSAPDQDDTDADEAGDDTDGAAGGGFEGEGAGGSGRFPGGAETISDAEAELPGLERLVVAAVGREPLNSVRVMRLLAASWLMRLPAPHARVWARACGVSAVDGGREEFRAQLARVHPDILEAWLLAGLVVGEPQLAGQLEGVLSSGAASESSTELPA